MDSTGWGSSIPSLTNTGRTRSAGCSRVSATSRRTAEVRRSRRGRSSGKLMAEAYRGRRRRSDERIGGIGRFVILRTYKVTASGRRSPRPAHETLMQRRSASPRPRRLLGEEKDAKANDRRDGGVRRGHGPVTGPGLRRQNTGGTGTGGRPGPVLP